MILSAQQLFSDAQAITGDAVSTNVIDLGVAGTPYGAQGPLNKDIGKGTPIPILIQAVEDFNTMTSLEVTIEVSDNSNLTSSTVLASQTITRADLNAKRQFDLQVIPTSANKRYLGVRYNVIGSNPSTGAITAGISMGNQTNTTGA